MQKYPETAMVILDNFHVDDMILGVNDIEQAVDLAKGVASILKSVCFELRKWVSNEPKVLREI